MSARSGKRQKTKAGGGTIPDDEYAEFTKQSRERGIEINGVHAARIPGAGLGLRTTRSIKKDERLVFVPASAIFKPDPKFLMKHSLHRTASPQAQLAISALAHFSKPSDEFLQIWQATWPTEQDMKESMPMFWNASLQELLPSAVRSPLMRLYRDFGNDVISVDVLCKAQGWSTDQFRYYWAIVNSRSFHWKPFSSSSSKGGNRSNALRPEAPGAMVMCPFLDLMNHGPSDSTVCVYQRADGYEVLANRSYKAGEEILATYGAHSNDRLLVHYGFILDHKQNADDDIRLDDVILPALNSEITNQLLEAGYLGGYALIPSQKEVCFKTQVAARATLLTSNEWEYFIQNGEDLGDDKQDAVDDFLRPLIQSYRKQAEKQLVAARKEHEVALRDKDERKADLTALDLIVKHWCQILAGLGSYLSSKRPHELYL